MHASGLSCLDPDAAAVWEVGGLLAALWCHLAV